MGLRYSGPKGDYPVYCCRADRDQSAAPLCQEVRALPVDDLVARLLLEALLPDRIAIAVAMLGQMEEEARQLERQWSLRRERARYEAERARRQYDAVEPENRLVARSLERAWEDKLRDLEAIEQEYRRWRCAGPLVLDDTDREALRLLAENLPGVWKAPATTADERKRILRFIIREVVLDQKRTRGQVWLKILWQTGAATEHRLQRCVQSYDGDCAERDRLRQRVTAINAAGKMDKEIAVVLNQEGLRSARGGSFTGGNVWLLRQRWKIASVKINGVGPNPSQWPDGTYSVQGAAALIGITPQTIFDYLRAGLLTGRQRAKGQPWQIDLPTWQLDGLRKRLQRTRRSKKEAS
jgi:hypothetical protein